MLQREKLDALFELLREMTLCVRRDALSKSMRWLGRIEKALMLMFVVTMTSLAVVAIGYRLASSKPFRSVPELVEVLYLVDLCLAVFYMIMIIVNLAIMFWRDRHQRFTAILRPLEKDLSGDVDFLVRLRQFNRSTLTYGLIQYRHHYGISDGRIAMIAGDIRKIGLFPALMAVTVAAAALLKESGSNPFLWAPVILAGCFYLVSVVVVGQRERAGQVVALLEYAVGQASDPDSIGSASDAGQAQRACLTEKPRSVAVDDKVSADGDVVLPPAVIRTQD